MKLTKNLVREVQRHVKYIADRTNFKMTIEVLKLLRNKHRGEWKATEL